MVVVWGGFRVFLVFVCVNERMRDGGGLSGCVGGREGRCCEEGYSSDSVLEEEEEGGQ